MKKIIMSLVLILLIFASASGLVLFTGILSHFQTTVNPPNISFISIEATIPSLNSLSTFSSETYDPAGTEIHISNINLTTACIYATDLSITERNVFTDLSCHVKIYNSTYTLLNSSFSPLLDQRLYVTRQLEGDWDLSLRYSGTTAIPETPTPVSFNVVMDLTTEVPICLQWLGAANQTNTTYWHPLENTNIGIGNQNCTTNHRGFCTLNLSDHAFYAATGNHSDYTITPTRSFIACANGEGSIGYPIILRFKE